MKKLLVVLLLCGWAAVGVAVAANTSGGCTWEISGTTLTISKSSGGDGAMPNYTNSASSIPWYSSCSSLTAVVISEGVTSIGDCAFYSCSNLTSVTFSEPSLVTSIGDFAFHSCSKLTSVIIPSLVTSISSSVFYGCIRLTSISVDGSNTSYSSSNGVLFNKDKTILIAYPPGKTNTFYAIPNSVTSIDYNGFSNCDNLTSVVIPNSVTSIGDGAFSSCFVRW